MTVRWTVRADGDQGAQFAPRPSPIRVAKLKIPADLAHLVERHLAKVEVAGSSPVIRSKRKTVPQVVRFFFWNPMYGAAPYQNGAKPSILLCKIVRVVSHQSETTQRNPAPVFLDISLADPHGLLLFFTVLSAFPSRNRRTGDRLRLCHVRL